VVRATKKILYTISAISISVLTTRQRTHTCWLMRIVLHYATVPSIESCPTQCLSIYTTHSSQYAKSNECLYPVVSTWARYPWANRSINRIFIILPGLHFAT
jgi:hypothetical protein